MLSSLERISDFLNNFFLGSYVGLTHQLIGSFPTITTVADRFQAFLKSAVLL
jgi:hypothetical protein